MVGKILTALFETLATFFLVAGALVLRYLLSFNDKTDCSFDIQAPIATLILLLAWIVVPFLAVKVYRVLDNGTKTSILLHIVPALALIVFIVLQAYALIFSPECASPLNYLTL